MIYLHFKSFYIPYIPVCIGSVYTALVYAHAFLLPKLCCSTGKGMSSLPKAADQPSFVQCVWCVHDKRVINPQRLMLGLSRGPQPSQRWR